MTGWIVLGVCTLAVAVLFAAVVPVLRRLGELRDAQLRVQRRAREADRLAPAVAALQERAAETERMLQVTQERAERMQARYARGL